MGGEMRIESRESNLENTVDVGGEIKCSKTVDGQVDYEDSMKIKKLTEIGIK